MTTRRPDAEWIRRLPKAEIHVHVEGFVPPVAGGDHGSIGDLPALLAHLDRACAAIDGADQLERIAYDAASFAGAAGTRHVDMIVNPAHWRAWRDRLSEFIAALDSGFAAAELDGHPPVALCVSIGRHQSAAEAVELAGWAASGATQRVVGLSVDGNEATSGRTGPRFADAFRLAARRGLRRAVHAGESSGPEGVRDALDLLLAERIDHGVRAVEDPSLVAELAARGVPLGVCPTSNVALGLVAILEQHPIDALRRAGVAVTINTDDPRLLGCDLVSEYAQCAAAFGWDQGVLIDLARASIDASFALADVKRELRADLTRFVSTDAP